MCSSENSKNGNLQTIDASKAGKKRRKYSRPCDRCALRKIRCSDVRPCTRCTASDVQCTSNRIRKKCGPKKKIHTSRDLPHEVHQAKSSSISSDSSSSVFSLESLNDKNSFLELEAVFSSPFTDVNVSPTIDKSDLIWSLQAYQKWFYSLWPVASVSTMMYRLSEINFTVALTYEDSLVYSLSTALSAAVLTQIDSCSISGLKMPSLSSADQCASEALRIREMYGHNFAPSIESLLVSFYLYLYSSNSKGSVTNSISYLQEAITTAQVLGLHDPITYLTKSPQESHLYSKIYYLLLLTERVNCIQHELHSVLNTGIPLPSIEDDENPSALVGFIDSLDIFVNPGQAVSTKFEFGTNFTTDTNNSNLIIPTGANFFDTYS